MTGWWTSYERYTMMQEREERNFAHHHNYEEWVQQQLWEAGERNDLSIRQAASNPSESCG